MLTNLSFLTFSFRYNLTVVDNYADSPHYEMNARTSVFGNNTYVNITAGQAWPAAAVAIMDAAGVRPGNAHPDYSPNICG